MSGFEKLPSLSFVDLLVSYGEKYPPRMRYQDGEDFTTWRDRLLAVLNSLRGPLPQRVPLRYEVVESVEEATHSLQLVLLAVSELSNLPACLLIPHGLRKGERRPALLVFHGHHRRGMAAVCGFGNEVDNEDAYGLGAVRAGFVVLAPAWWGWLGRDGHLPLIGQRDKCNVIQMAAAMYGLNVLALHIQDAQAAFDFLARREEVDANRIGCIGNSYGGRTAMWVTIFEPRIRACVAAGCMNIFRERSQKLSSCGIQYLPGVLQYADVPDLFGLIAPRPLQLQAGEGDGLITPADRDMIDATVRSVYRAAGAEEKYEYVKHQHGHNLDWPAAERFLMKNLQKRERAP